MTPLQMCLNTLNHAMDIGLGYAALVCLYKWLMHGPVLTIERRTEPPYTGTGDPQ